MGNPAQGLPATSQPHILSHLISHCQRFWCPFYWKLGLSPDQSLADGALRTLGTTLGAQLSSPPSLPGDQPRIPVDQLSALTILQPYPYQLGAQTLLLSLTLWPTTSLTRPLHSGPGSPRYLAAPSTIMVLAEPDMLPLPVLPSPPLSLLEAAAQIVGQ